VTADAGKGEGRCETCDRATCKRDRFSEAWDAATRAEVEDCRAHAVDWRARAKAMEAERDAARQTVAKAEALLNTWARLVESSLIDPTTMVNDLHELLNPATTEGS
jgi:hypothetical protein